MAGSLEVWVLMMVMTSHRERKCIRRQLIYFVFVAITVNNEDKVPARCIIFGCSKTRKRYITLYTFRKLLKVEVKAKRQQ